MTLPPAVVFLLFVVASFLMLRYVLRNFASEARSIYAPPVLIFAGVISGMLFFRLQLGQYYIWFAMIFALIILRWHAQSRPESKAVKEKVEQIVPTTRKNKGNLDVIAEVVQTYTMTRRLLSFGLVSYLATFSAVFYFLFTRAS